jgi:hypothetical protein
MKIIVALVLIFSVFYARADCLDTWLSYDSSKLILRIDFSGGCYQGPLIIHFTKFSKGDPRWPSGQSHWTSIPFDRECSEKRSKGVVVLSKEGEILEFSCRRDGASPLAGATYRYRETKANHQCADGTMALPDRWYICVRGCGPATPKELAYEYSEGGC